MCLANCFVLIDALVLELVNKLVFVFLLVDVLVQALIQTSSSFYVEACCQATFLASKLETSLELNE